jgi:multidrug transporter EmrE-like cation transporter
MMKAVIFCCIYALLNVSGAAIIKWKLKGKALTELKHWVNLLLDLQVISAFALIFISALVIFKALSSADFTFVIPVSAGINFILTVIAGYYIFKDNLNVVSFIGFTLIISGIILLSINSAKHAAA